MVAIKEFTDKVFANFTQTDPQTGQKMVRLGDKKFGILLQREKDKFYLDTGLTTE